MPIITVPKALRDKLGEDGADALVELVNQSGQQHKEDILEFVEEKFERRLSEEVNNLREDIHANSVAIQELRAELVDRIETTRADLIDRIEKSNANLIKWVFAFWVGQVAVLTGILFAFVK